MSLEQFKNRNVGTQTYKTLDVGTPPETGMEKFTQVVKRTFSGELFVGLWVVMKAMLKALFQNDMHTVKYPFEKMPISPRYRAIHDMLRLLESGNYRCIGCGLCEKICISNCIAMETRYDENQRKEVSEYTINFGRCIFCGYCAEVCPELAIVHGPRYENASEQRASFSLFEDMLTPIDKQKNALDNKGIFASKNGDFNVEEKYTFEIGGKNKSYKQVKDVENSYVVADDIEVGFGNKIPLWLFGFLY